MKLTYYFIFFFSCSFVFAQHSKIDSLLALNKESKLDSLKLTYLSKIVTHYQTNNIDLAVQYNDSLYINAQKLGMTGFELLHFIQKGIIEFRKTNITEAVEVWKNGLNNDEIGNYPIQHSNLLNNVAIGYKSLRKKDSVLKYMLKSYELNKKLNNDAGLVANHYSLADFYSSYLDYDNSIKHIKKLQEIAIKTDNKIALARSYVILAKISREEYDFKDSEKLFYKAQKIYAETEPDNLIMARGLTFEALVSVYRDNKFVKAVNGFLKLKSDYSDKLKEKDFWLLVNAYILSCYNKLEDKNRGKKFYNEIIKTYTKKVSSESTNGIINNNLTEYEILTNKVNRKSIDRLQSVLNEINTKEDLELRSSTYKNIADYYSLVGNSKKALENFNIYDKLRDSIANNRTTTINLSLKRKFNEELKEKENLQLKADNTEQALLTQKANTRNWILGLGILLLGVSAFFIWRRYKAEAKAKQIISNQKDEIELQKNRVETLQKELHHRMKNNLSFIDLFINLAKGRFEDKAYQNKLNELQNRMRSMFEVHKQLFKKDDITTVQAKNYIDTLVENVKQAYEQDSITITNTTNEKETLLANTSFPVGLIVNEFVTNSYKYAFDDQKEGTIHIALTSKNNLYQLSLKDNGKGLSKDFDINELDSFGLETIKLLTKEYGGTFEIDGTNGVTMNITLPKNAA